MVNSSKFETVEASATRRIVANCIDVSLYAFWTFWWYLFWVERCGVLQFGLWDLEVGVRFMKGVRMTVAMSEAGCTGMAQVTDEDGFI